MGSSHGAEIPEAFQNREVKRKNGGISAVLLYKGQEYFAEGGAY